MKMVLMDVIYRTVIHRLLNLHVAQKYRQLIITIM